MQDQDRIFTNIYGMQLALKGAQARGHWDCAYAIIKSTRQWIR